jgi:hypothetical protein
MSAAGAGATGPLCPIVTAIPNNRHCPFTGANDNSKLTGLSNLLAPRIAPELVNSPMDWRRAT